MFASAAGIWLILFGIIAIECIQAPRTSLRRLFFFEVPVLYYPFAIYLFFALLSASLSFSYLLSIGVGYAYGYGFLDKTKLSASKAKQWEETILANFTSREGWVVGHAATGSDAWNESSETGLVSVFSNLFDGSKYSSQLINTNVTHVTTFVLVLTDPALFVQAASGETHPTRHHERIRLRTGPPVARTAVARPRHFIGNGDADFGRRRHASRKWTTDSATPGADRHRVRRISSVRVVRVRSQMFADSSN
jgi:hypothetical protein